MVKVKSIVIALVLSAVVVSGVESANKDTKIYFPAIFRPDSIDRIQPIGDSITRGFDCGDGWRGMIRQFGFRFVGTIDGVHDGHGGWWTYGNPTGENISDYIESWISDVNPDMVILSVGTDDYLNNHLDSYSVAIILDKINVPVVLVGMPNVIPLPDPIITVYNHELSKIAAARGVEFVEVESHLRPEHMDADGVRPNCSGYSVISNLIAEAIARR